MPDIDGLILQHVNAPNYRPVKPKVIAKQLGFDAPSDVSRLKREIKRLVKSGKIAYGPSHLICPVATEHPAAAKTIKPKGKTLKNKPANSSKHIVGTFRKAQGGFGFVRPEGTARADGRDADIFVPASATGDAANGDVVRIRITDKKDRMGKISGRIIDIVERATNRFVGTYLEQGGMGLVQIDGKIFTEPVYVGDPGAKGAQVDDKVVIEMVRFPSHVRDGEGVIVDILGQRGQPGVDTLSIINEFNLPGDFDDAALENARKEAEKFDESIGPRRKDLIQSTPRRRATSMTRSRSKKWRAATGCLASISPTSHILSDPNRDSIAKPKIEPLASTCPTKSSPCCRRLSQITSPVSSPTKFATR